MFNLKGRWYSRDIVRLIMEGIKAISYSHRIRLNGGYVFVIGRKLFCLSGNVVIL